jgi:hypothetical protein
MQEPEFVRIDFYSNASWKGRMQALLDLLMAQTLLRPDKIGHRLDKKKDTLELTVEQVPHLEKRWKEAIHIPFFKYDPEYWLILNRHLMRPKNAEPDRLNMGLDITFFATKDHVEHFLQFSKSLYQWGDMLYGFVANRQDYKAQTWLPQQVIIGNKLVGAVGDNEVMNALPGIFWANFFGPDYVDWFGREKFDRLPCYRLEELPDGGRLVLTSPSPLEYDTSGETQEAIKHYLGRLAFGDVQHPERPTISPFQDGVIQLPDESADWPQRLKDLHKQVFGDSDS